MWTKVAKVALVIYLIVGVVYPIVLAGQTGWVLWWIIPLLWGAVFLSASVIGTLIEISNKTSENQEILVRIVTRLGTSSQSSSSAYPSSMAYQSSLVERLKSDSPDNRNVPSPWRCPDCGEYNSPNATFCKSCGRYK